jgi:acyl-coenzyme A thioesterase PaaI-like protein
MSIPFGVHIPFVANLGFTLEKFENGTSELHYSPRAEHLNSFDITHG